MALKLAIWLLPLAHGQIERHLQCPFSKLWLEHGPERASEMLGLPYSGHGERRLGLTGSTWGTCQYTSPHAGPTCVQFQGSSWTQSSATTACSAASSNAGTLKAGGTCPTTSKLAGWCTTQSGTLATMMETSAMAAKCTDVSTACSNFMSGTFVNDGSCASSAAPSPPSGPLTCAVAPGPIGGAHQLASSTGYSNNCSGTPAQLSPYMYPMRWKADIEWKSMSAGSDTVNLKTNGKVWYMLDKNWKRLDMLSSVGIEWAAGQNPCPDGDLLAVNKCKRNDTLRTTTIHRQNLMYFIYWAADDTTILNCTYMDLGVIGNVRPDWFMDKVGDSTDIQYPSK
jgi:hypothetical protein